jgi:hypothetical protein
MQSKDPMTSEADKSDARNSLDADWGLSSRGASSYAVPQLVPPNFPHLSIGKPGASDPI